MHKLCSKLLLYSKLGEDSILSHLAELYEDWQNNSRPRYALCRDLLCEVKRLLDVATTYGFDENLWANYLTFVLIMNENSFSLSCERTGATLDGSVNHFALQDFAVFHALLHFDFSFLEDSLGIDCFSVLQDYKAIPKRERHYHKAVGEQVKTLSRKLLEAENAQGIFVLLTQHYERVGVGQIGHNRAFRIEPAGEEMLQPITNTQEGYLSDLVGYHLQKRQLVENTEAFLAGRGANNVLLYGDSGTGKSSSVKALLNEYHAQGLRMIELYKHQLCHLPQVMSEIKHRNYAFILFMDDLSFEEDEIEYKYLKALIEGGMETRPENVRIYATSNRRHLIRETWNDRQDTEFTGDIHRSDTVEEKLSLSARFGLQINYSIPNRAEFQSMVLHLARVEGLLQSDALLLAEANKWELRHGGVSGRTARQFIDFLLGKEAQC